MARAGELGADHALTFLREVDNINMRCRTRMVELAREACTVGLGCTSCGAGRGVQAGSDDVRDSPALNVAGQIELQGATVSVYDPKALDNSRALFPTLSYATSTLEDARALMSFWCSPSGQTSRSCGRKISTRLCAGGQ